MSTWLRYLWKEWRDHRMVVLGYALLMPLLLGVASLTLPERQVSDRWFGGWACLVGLVVAVLAIASELVPGEERRGRLDFLRRLPADLGPAFLGKLAFLLLAVPAFPAYAWWLAGVFGKAEMTPGFSVLLGYAACVAAWAFAVSCWLPRGALAAPGAVLVLALLLLPVVLVYESLPGVGLRPGVDTAFRRLVTAGALVVAWASFSRGRRFGRGLGAAALCGLPIAAVLFLPAWIYAAVERYDYRHFDPHSERLVIADAYLGAGGRHLFANAFLAQRLGFDPDDPYTRYGAPLHAMVVDLETGRVKSNNRAGDAFTPVFDDAHPSWTWALRPRELTVVALRDHAQSVFDRAEGRGGRLRAWMHYFDGRTARLIESGWSDMRFPAVERLAPRGPALAPEGYRVTGPCGLGVAVRDEAGREYFWDPFRRKLYARSDVAPVRAPCIRPGRWLARSFGRLKLYDPDTRAFEEVPGAPLARIALTLDDGRVVDGWGALRVVDPETGAAWPLGADAWGCSLVGRTPGGRYCVQLQDHGSFRYARLDPATLRLDVAGGVERVGHLEFRVVAVPDEESLIGIYRRRQIVRVRFGGDARRVLWPR